MRKVYHLIEAEEDRQSKKLEKRGIFGAFTWLAFLSEEVGELSMALTAYFYRGSEDRKNIVRQAVQVAALAIKFAEIYGDDDEG